MTALAPIRARRQFRPWARWLGGTPLPAERYEIMTNDGVRLAIQRVRQPGTQGPPVVLVHGLASSGVTFHFPDRSLATYLAERGFDCFIPDLRGSGASEIPRHAWDLHDYLQHDLPSAIAVAKRESGHERVHFVGHSMGGILLFCYLALHGDQHLSRAVSIAAALDYTRGQSRYARMLGLRGVLSHVSYLPYGGFAHLVAPMFGWLGNELDRFHAWPTNIEPTMLRRIYASAFHDVPSSLLMNLSQAFEPGGLTSRDGSVRFGEQARDLSVPTLLLGGSRDRQCPPEAVAGAAEMFAPGAHELRLYGREHGQLDEYGHFDLIIGKRAPTEVWPHIGDWLARGAVA